MTLSVGASGTLRVTSPSAAVTCWSCSKGRSSRARLLHRLEREDATYLSVRVPMTPNHPFHLPLRHPLRLSTFTACGDSRAASRSSRITSSKVTRLPSLCFIAEAYRLSPARVSSLTSSFGGNSPEASTPPVFLQFPGTEDCHRRISHAVAYPERVSERRVNRARCPGRRAQYGQRNWRSLTSKRRCTA